MLIPLEELKARVAAYETQNEAARALGISSGFLSEMLSGKRGIGPDTLKILGIRIRYEYIDKAKRQEYNRRHRL